MAPNAPPPRSPRITQFSVVHPLTQMASPEPGTVVYVRNAPAPSALPRPFPNRRARRAAAARAKRGA
jgi:hypothetical protein